MQSKKIIGYLMAAGMAGSLIFQTPVFAATDDSSVFVSITEEEAMTKPARDAAKTKDEQIKKYADENSSSAASSVSDDSGASNAVQKSSENGTAVSGSSDSANGFDQSTAAASTDQSGKDDSSEPVKAGMTRCRADISVQDEDGNPVPGVSIAVYKVENKSFSADVSSLTDEFKQYYQQESLEYSQKTGETRKSDDTDYMTKVLDYIASNHDSIVPTATVTTGDDGKCVFTTDVKTSDDSLDGTYLFRMVGNTEGRNSAPFDSFCASIPDRNGGVLTRSQTFLLTLNTSENGGVIEDTNSDKTSRTSETVTIDRNRTADNADAGKTFQEIEKKPETDEENQEKQKPKVVASMPVILGFSLAAIGAGAAGTYYVVKVAKKQKEKEEDDQEW